MLKKIVPVFVLCWAQICASTAANAMDLSFNDAVARIEKESTDIMRADANLAGATAGLRAANASRWFNVEASAQYMNMVDVSRPLSGNGSPLPPELGGLLEQLGATGITAIPDNLMTAGVTITQPIYTFGKIGNAVDSMRGAIAAATAGGELTRREVRYSAANLYWTAKMMDELVPVYEHSLALAVDARKQLTSAGRANRANLIKIESDIAAKEISLSDAKFNRDTAFDILKIMAGIDATETITLSDSFPLTFTPIEYKKLENNPEWNLYEQQIKMYEDSARAKRAGGYPTLAAMGSYSYTTMANASGELFDKEGSQSAYWGVSLTVPVFAGGLHRAQATADAQQAIAARADLEQSKRMRTHEYETAIKKYDQLRGNLKGLTNARDLAARANQMSIDRFAAGQTSAVELADVSAALSQLDIALLSARYNILMSAETVRKLGNN